MYGKKLSGVFSGLAVLSLISCLVFLQGCENLQSVGSFLGGSFEAETETKHSKSSKRAKSNEAASLQALSPLSIRELVDGSVEFLRQGKADEAYSYLSAVMEREPSKKEKRFYVLAQSLIQQMDEDPVELLGRDHFPYVVKNGDSLSKIASVYLKDQYMFYALARYNGISNPENLSVGQQLNIPGVLRESSFERELSPGSGDMDTVVGTALKDLTPDTPEELPQASLLEQAQSLWDQLRYNDLILLLEPEIDQSQQSGTVLVGYLLKAHLQIAKQDYSAEGLAAVLERWGQIKRLIQVANADNDTLAQLQKLQSVMVSECHKGAMILYKKHRLDQAISSWTDCLHIDAEHQSSKIWKERAEELKRSLPS